ncbi:MAG TPA: diaminopimelate epimerase [Melioribacteraceae bacterium]|nr:diaminopimelate epimerase [Melioribacteraceae bacterium]
MELKFKKYSGAGNDFVLIDQSINCGINLTSEVIQKICDRRNGVGADGILFITESNTADFELYYYNADGSLGSLCGNGSRCAIKYAFLSKKFDGFNTQFLCGDKLYTGEVFENGNVKFYLQDPTDFKENLKIEISDNLINAAFINTGSPHLIININEFSDVKEGKIKFNEFPVYEYGKMLRYHKLFEPKGTNVNFIEINEDVIYIRTYERGVEAETLACGTGSVASALICSVTYGMQSPIKLITRGNDELTVEFKKENNSFNNIALVGPAKEIFSGIIYI